MLFKGAVLSTLVLVAQATKPPVHINCGNPQPICQQIESYIPFFPQASQIASALCSQVLCITATTVTSTSTCTNKITSTLKAATTVSLPTTITNTVYPSSTITVPGTSVVNTNTITTITSTPTTYATTQTCYATSSSAPHKEKKRGWPFGLPQGPAAYSSACSCFGVSLSPTSTAYAATTTNIISYTTCVTGTATVYTTTITNTVSAPVSTITATSYVATTTIFTSTATSTATAAVVSTGTYTAIVPTASTYTSPADGSTFTDYNGYDFYGGDLTNGPCPASSSRLMKRNGITGPTGQIPCVGFNGCQDACAIYNDQLIASGNTTAPTCVGVTYHTGAYCYLKSSVPGNTGNVCNVIASAGEMSAILTHQG